MRTSLLQSSLGLSLGLAIGFTLLPLACGKKEKAGERIAADKTEARTPVKAEAPKKKTKVAPDGDMCSWTQAQWVVWRDAEIKKILLPTYEYEGERLLDRTHVIASSNTAYQQMNPCVEQEPQKFEPSTPLGKAMGNFYSFIKQNHWMALTNPQGQATHALAYTITDKEYWNYAKDYVEFPELLRSQKFLKLMASPSGYQEAAKLIDAKNKTLPEDKQWLYLPYRAQFIKTPDNTTFGRFLVVVRGEPAPQGKTGTVDKWIQFGLVTPDMDQSTEVHSVSCVSVHREKPTDKTTKTYIVDFWRNTKPDGEIVIEPNMFLDPDPSSNCYACHKTPVMPIHPKWEFSFNAKGELVPEKDGSNPVPEFVNQLIPTYGPPDFGVMDTLAFGPAMGPVGRERSDEFFSKCATGVESSNYDNLRNAMNCTQCHSESLLGPINYLLAVRSERDVNAFENHKNMIETYIDKGWMPPDVKLQEKEKEALWNCLADEYYNLKTQEGLLVEWLQGAERQGL